jgi:hypothetical protein
MDRLWMGDGAAATFAYIPKNFLQKVAMTGQRQD